MSLQQLIKLVPPPKKPLQVDNTDRAAVEERIGSELPDDFWEFGKKYGSGMINVPGLYVLNACAANFPDRLEAAVSPWRPLEGEEEMLPYDVYPDRPGLLTWGVDENASGLFWLTEGKPNDWPVVTLPHGDIEFPGPDRFEMSFTTFLCQAFQQKIECVAWPKRFFDDRSEVYFIPREYELPRHDSMNFYQMYIQNGNAADFWVVYDADPGNVYYHAKSIAGKQTGPLEDEPPQFGNPPVIVDVYVDETRTMTNEIMADAEGDLWRQVERPKWFVPGQQT